MSALVNDLLDRWAGKPILVIGGGPSVNEDLPRLNACGVKPAAVISANAHGAKQSFFPVDIGVNVDKIHNILRVPMEKHMRDALPGALIVNRHSWADYRLPDWRFAGNSGLTAIAVACLLGGNPVIATGMDFWHGTQRYFHSNEPCGRERKTQPRAAVVKRDRDRIQPLMEFVRGVPVRPMSGPLCAFFKTYDPKETEFWSTPTAYRQKLLANEQLRVQITKTFMFSNHDPLLPGVELTVSDAELQANPKLRASCRVLQS